MQRQAVRMRKDFDMNDETQKITDKSRSIMLALIRANHQKLLDKEAICCNMATD